MKQLPAGLQAHLDTGSTTLCWCWALTRSDGQVLGFTDHDRDLSFDGNIYEASSGFSASEVQSSVGLNVDNLDAAGALQSSSLNEDDLAAGYFDDADIKIYRVNWQDISQRVLVRSGSLGEIKRGEFAFSAEIRGLSHYLQQPQGRIIQFGCDADLGDARCGVNLDGANFKATATATVDAVIDGRTVVVDGLSTFVSGWFSRGLVHWTIGLNTGQSVEVKSHHIVGGQVIIKLWQEVAFGIEHNDAFEITAGCDKQFTTCREKFSNGINFRGFPYIPGNDFVTSYPNRDDVGNDGGSQWTG